MARLAPFIVDAERKICSQGCESLGRGGRERPTTRSEKRDDAPGRSVLCVFSVYMTLVKCVIGGKLGIEACERTADTVISITAIFSQKPPKECGRELEALSWLEEAEVGGGEVAERAWRGNGAPMVLWC